jgi:hypothetical protein
MQRREFITLFGGTAATWPLAARAQQPKQIRRIGVITGDYETDSEVQVRIGAFQKRLAEVGQELPSPEAAAAFYNEYTPARSPKAFVVSPKGAWGWKAGAASQREAVQEAIASCDVQRPAYTPACRVVNVDGEWVQTRRR